MRLVLASASPRRAELLSAARLAFEICPASIDEVMRPGEAAQSYVRRMALEKAVTVGRRHTAAVVLGADTAVVIDSEILGKPRSGADARLMLSRLSGRAHFVLTGIAIYEHARAYMETDVVQTLVWMAALSPDEIDAYVESQEPLDKAGGYAIQGIASRFIHRIEGSYTNVVGLPVAAVYRLLRKLGAELATPRC